MSQAAIGVEIPSLDLRLWSLDDDAIAHGQVWIASPIAFLDMDGRKARIAIHHRPKSILKDRGCRIHFFRNDEGEWRRLPDFYIGRVEQVKQDGDGFLLLTLSPDYHEGPQQPRYFSHADQSELHPGDLGFEHAQYWIDRRKTAEFLWPAVTRQLPGGDVVSIQPDLVQPIVVDLPVIVMDTSTSRQIGNAKWAHSRRMFPPDVDVRSVNTRIARFGVNENGIGTVRSTSRGGTATGEFRLRRGDEQALLIYRQEVRVLDEAVDYIELEKGLYHNLDLSLVAAGTIGPEIDSAGFAPPFNEIARITGRDTRINHQGLTIFGITQGEALLDPSFTDYGRFVFRVVDTLPEHLPPAIRSNDPVFVTETDQEFDVAARFDPTAMPFNATFWYPQENAGSIGYVYRHEGGKTLLDPVRNGRYKGAISATRTPVGVSGPRHELDIVVSGVEPVALPPLVVAYDEQVNFDFSDFNGWPVPDFGSNPQRFDKKFVEAHTIAFSRHSQTAVRVSNVSAGIPRHGPDYLYSADIRGKGHTYEVRAGGIFSFGSVSGGVYNIAVGGSYVSAVNTAIPNRGIIVTMRKGQTATLTGARISGEIENLFPDVASAVLDTTTRRTITITAKQLGMTGVAGVGSGLLGARIVVIE